MYHMNLNLKVKPLSINAAYSGRRFKTEGYRDFSDEVLYLLPRRFEKICGELSMKYIFHVKNYEKSDVDNMVKTIQDLLVQSEIIADDKHIKEIYCRKEKVEDSKDEKIEICITPFKT